jgi:lysophospholipase L1-like esterase
VLLGSLVAGFLLFLIVELLLVVYNGTAVARPTVPSGAQTIFGRGSPVRYVVMGDSTTVSQGGDYTQGYAVQSAEYLAGSSTVTWLNLGVPGARAKDVATSQLARALKHKPAIVLVAVGANDVTHLTPIPRVRRALKATIQKLQQVNPAVYIVLTGSPDMGAVPRFPQPLRWLMGKRTAAVNRMVVRLAKTEHVTFAPIAQKTGPAFRHNPQLFAADKFHPTTEGYALWTPVIIAALSKR